MTSINFKIKKLWKYEKDEIILIILTTFGFFIAGDWIRHHATQYQEFAIHIPILILGVAAILYSVRFALIYRKFAKMEDIENKQTLKDRHYRTKLCVSGLNASSTLFVDLTILYALGLSYFVFGFDTGNDQFYHAFEHLHIYEIAYPIVAIFTLICIRKK